MTAHRLPWRGLGLSSNLSASDSPHPYRLWDASPGLFDYVEYSAPLSLEETRAQATLFSEMWSRREALPVLFHPVHLNLYGPELESPQALAHLDAHARAVGSAWVGNDVGWWHARGQPFPGYLYISPPLSDSGVEDAAVHALHVQSALSVPLVLENPAVFARRGPLHVLDFMAKLHARTGLPLLLDLGHLLSFQLSAGLPLTAGWDGFPFNQVVEIHLAGGVVTERGARRFYVDDHSQPVREEVLELLPQVLDRCANLRAVTFEGDGHPAEIAAITLRRLRALVPRLDDASSAQPAAGGPERSQGSPRPSARADASRPWELFEESHGSRPPSEDPQGVAAEQDFRLAVIAEALDRDWPLSRLLLLGTREALIGFASSQELRALFEGSGKSLGHAFASHARRLLREAPDEAVSAVLAFETLLPNLFSRPPSDGLSRHARKGQYPVDFTELVFAAAALGRHLVARAWASGSLELSGLDALHQVARRAPRALWTFCVRREKAGLKVVRWTGACVEAAS